MVQRSKTHQRLEERFLIGRNRTTSANFRGIPLFQARYNIKTQKQSISSTSLVSVGCERLAEGKGHGIDSWFNGSFVYLILERVEKLLLIKNNNKASMCTVTKIYSGLLGCYQTVTRKTLCNYRSLCLLSLSHGTYSSFSREKKKSCVRTVTLTSVSSWFQKLVGLLQDFAWVRLQSFGGFNDICTHVADLHGTSVCSRPTRDIGM